MLIPWLEVPRLTARAEEFSSAAGLDLIRLGCTADADEIKDTAVTQPLVVAAALLAASLLHIPHDAVTAGHSVGELAAAALAGVIGSESAVRVAAVRGAAMADACALTPTSMSAVLGGDTEVVLAALGALGLVGANVNGGGQIVAAGSAAALAALSATPPIGARVIPLPVAGAFHTEFMSSAQAAVRAALDTVPAADPVRPLLSNSDGSQTTSGRSYLDLLATQVTRPVRWDLCMATLARLGVTGVLELPPAGALVGLIKRDLPGVATMALKTPADLDKAAFFIKEHSVLISGANTARSTV